jgi:hypothetical protein
MSTPRGYPEKGEKPLLIRRILASLLMSVALVTGTASAASAFPGGPAEEEEEYCGPGQDYTVYDWREGGLVTYCQDTVYVPHQILVPRPSVWWNPWTW